mmetsp:Transcript_1313/g.3671  ORF Transcript_1313/g.3671 Transcript_1313/m.3671 type:complete len:95 (+) Transcript_1313:66-350(+)
MPAARDQRSTRSKPHRQSVTSTCRDAGAAHCASTGPSGPPQAESVDGRARNRRTIGADAPMILSCELWREMLALLHEGRAPRLRVLSDRHAPRI